MNRSFPRLILLILVIAIIVGFYRGWVTLTSSNPDGGNHKLNVDLTVDQDKIRHDANAVQQETNELLRKATGPVVEPSPARLPN